MGGGGYRRSVASLPHFTLLLTMATPVLGAIIACPEKGNEFVKRQRAKYFPGKRERTETLMDNSILQKLTLHWG